ncbi:hypothetical protein MUK42_24210 [Musa troglodytarum]|uniref:Uncharacterized protein n=1 Tax=Musa troglodytarum TaxID=320322 RepID=A0A9E7EVE7_9LILI|nr:hypothetical protein MUK42_24210 [Musa troglodytarum]
MGQSLSSRMAVGFSCWLAVASAGFCRDRRRPHRGVSCLDLEPWIPSDPRIRETSAGRTTRSGSSASELSPSLSNAGWFFSTAPSRSSPTLVWSTCPMIATCMSAHGCWIYAKHAKENDEANAFFKRDFGEDLHATLTGTNRNRKASKSHSFCEHGDKEQHSGFWGYLMQIAYQLMGCMHSLNFVFLLLDTALNSLVALPFSQALNSLGSPLVLVPGIAPRPLLWSV